MATEAPRTPGMWVLFSIETGERFERWPIDGKAMLACGAYTRDVPGTGEKAGALPVSPGLDPASITPGVDPVPHVAAAEKATELSPHKLMHPEPKEEPEVPEAEAWTMSNYTPEKYLARWPKGPKADLARSVLGTD